MRYDELADYPCSITRPLVVLGDRWTLLVLKYAFAGVRRFTHFQNALGISKSRLQDRLDRLVGHEILLKRPAETGAYEEYRLTQKGHELYPILMAIKDWGDRHMAPDGPPVLYQHAACGGEAHVILACDHCTTELTARDIDPQPGLGCRAS